MVFDKLVSVIIPCWNSEKYIAQTIESVLFQTYPFFELIIIDDGSTDNSAKIIQSFKDRRIQYHYEQNSGPSAARNKGIVKSSGHFLAFLDSDDIWLPDKLEKQLKELKKFDLVYCNYTNIDDYNNQLLLVERPVFSPKNQSDPFLLGKYILGSNSSVIMKKEIISSVGLFNESLSYAEDQEYWTRIASGKYSFKYLNEQLVKIRIRDNSNQARSDKEKRFTSFKIMINTFLKFDRLTKLHKGTIYNEYFFIIYSYSDNFMELLRCFRMIIKNNLKLIKWSHIRCLLKILPRKLLRSGI